MIFFNSDSLSESPFELCCRLGFDDILNYVLENKSLVCSVHQLRIISSNQRIPLIMLCEHGRFSTVQIFLQRATNEVEEDVLKEIIDSRGIRGETAIFQSCRYGHLQILKILHKAGGNLHLTNLNGCSPLRAACVETRYEIVRYLSDVRSIQEEVRSHASASVVHHKYFSVRSRDS